MSEFLPEAAQEETRAPDTLSVSIDEAMSSSEAPLDHRAKITVPLSLEDEHRPSLPRVTRPLPLAEGDIADVTPALSASLPRANITRPLAEEVSPPAESVSTMPIEAAGALAEEDGVASPAESMSTSNVEVPALPTKEEESAPQEESASTMTVEAPGTLAEDELDTGTITEKLPALRTPEVEEATSLEIAGSIETDGAEVTAEEHPASAELAGATPVAEVAPEESEVAAEKLEDGEEKSTEQEPVLDPVTTLPEPALEQTEPDLTHHATLPLTPPAEEAVDALAHQPTAPLEADRPSEATEACTPTLPLSTQLASPPAPAAFSVLPGQPPASAQATGVTRREPGQITRQDAGERQRYIPRRFDKRQRRLKRIYRLQYFSRKNLRRARAQDRRERRRLWTTIWTTTSTLLLLFLALGGVAGYIAYNFVVATQGTYAGQVLTLRDLLPPDNLKMYDSQGRLIDQMTDQGIHTEVSYKQIAPDLVNATVAIEDHSFWQNSGVDVTGIVRAVIADLNSGQQAQGGSTITQQLIKQLVVGSSDDAKRKLSELVLAPQVNNHYSKQDILEMYLNTIYYGHQAYGIEAAATVYFGLERSGSRSAASQLDLAQAAFLAGLPRNASLYDPAVNAQAASARFYDVLQAMVAQHYITQVQAQTAYQEGTAPDFFKSSPTLVDQAPHFDEYVLAQLEQLYHLSRAQLSRSGLVVYTTLDIELQQKILKIMRQHIAEIRAAHHVTNAAEVLIDFHTGAIISMLGSIDYNDKSIDGQYNVALAYRQPGSSFKPFVYVTAFAQGASPAQAIDDAKTTFQVPDSNPPTYTPSNYDQHFHGHMTLRCALQNSLNVPAVRVLQHVGIANAMNTARAMGITTYEGTPGLSLVLGGLDVRLLDQTSAYGVFANGGVRQPYYSISKIVKGTTGKVLFQHQTTPGVQALTPQLAYMMTSVLSDNTSRTPEFFDCNVLQLYANSQQDCYNGNRGQVRPAAAKTGTTQDFRDNWTVGYTSDFVMGVWAGNDDNTPMLNVTGVQGAAPIWHDAMLLAEQGRPIQDFQNPGGLERATVTYADGVKSTDWFLPGTVPHSSTAPDEGDSDQPASTPYCGTFSFAFPPPAGGGIPTNGAWW